MPYPQDWRILHPHHKIPSSQLWTPPERLRCRGESHVRVLQLCVRSRPIARWMARAITWNVQDLAFPIQSRTCIYNSLTSLLMHTSNFLFVRYGRLLSPKYADGISAPTRSVTGDELPSARLVSLVAFGEQDVPDPQFTLHNMQWGQIITHDMSMQAGGTQSSKIPTI